MPADDRDPKFERALAHHLRSGSGPAGCPDAETLAAYHERSMSLEEMAHWKEHISGCAACEEALALVEATEKQLAEDWQGEDVPVLEAVGAAQERTRGVPARKEDVAVEESAAAAAPVEITKRGRPVLLRWAVPVGAVAAGVLVWIGIHEQRALQSAKSTAIQVAQNQPLVPPEQRRNEVLQQTPTPVERDTRQAQLDSAMENKKMVTLEKEAGNRVVMAPAAKPVAPEKDLEATKRKAEDHLAGALLDRTTPSTSAGASSQPSPSASAAGTVEVMPSPSAQDKAVVQSQAADNVNTNAMMMKQGVNGRNSTALAAPTPAPGIILTPDNRVWWKLGSNGALELTTDGGAHWKTVNTGADSQLTAGSAPSSSVCWIAGKSGALLLTTDRGEHWSKIVSPIAGDLGGVHARDEKHASVWDAANQAAFETADGGATWVQTANE